MITDRELLRRYFDEGSETAFEEITRRHVDLVYGTALRHLCGNTTLAEDVTQSVFAALASKRGTGLHIKHLTGWLYRTTRFTASHTVRSERRRQNREQQAFAMHHLHAPDSSDLPNLPLGVLDELLETLDELDRESILLRFFEGQSFAAIGLALDISEDAARMRVNRALERLRVRLAKTGITSSAAALGATLAGHAVAAPAALAAQVSAATLAGTAALASTGAAPQLGLFAFMSTTKSIVWFTSAAAILAGGYSSYHYREAAAHRLAIRQLTEERTLLREQLAESERRAAVLAGRSLLASRESVEQEQETRAQPAASAPPPLSTRLASATSGPGTVRQERLTRLKPLLEAGLPIKGAVVLHVEGAVMSRPVELVIGQTTHVEGDDGTYAITPALNEDGSISHALHLVRIDPQSGREQIVSGITVTQIPWEGFSMRIDGLSVMAFDPDPGSLGIN
jgi:RNA polymerase sigma factor (sigma-70 family)